MRQHYGGVPLFFLIAFALLFFGMGMAALITTMPTCQPHETAVFSEWPWQFGWYCGRRT